VENGLDFVRDLSLNGQFLPQAVILYSQMGRKDTAFIKTDFLLCRCADIRNICCTISVWTL